MRTVRTLALALLAATTFAPPAHADIEMQTIECTGTLAPGTLTTPGYHAWNGSITCTLGSASETGPWTPYDTFSSGVAATVDNQTVSLAVPFTVGTLNFTGPESYSLHFEDPNTAGYVAMTNEYDKVNIDSPYAYHVRAGYLRPACNTCLVGSVAPDTFYFLAEYVYDLPVA